MEIKHITTDTVVDAIDFIISDVNYLGFNTIITNYEMMLLLGRYADNVPKPKTTDGDVMYPAGNIGNVLLFVNPQMRSENKTIFLYYGNELVADLIVKNIK